MTTEEKARVSELRGQGYAFSRISQITGIPLNTVKSFCYRNPYSVGAVLCRQCGKAVRQTPGARQKIYCSTACRLTWWNSHPDQVRRTRKTHVCLRCGRSFETHIDKQLYCSRACYADARRREAAG